MEKQKEVLLTVLMSVYKEEEKWLRASIESILTQTYSDFEFVIINDNPERTLNNSVVESYAHTDNRIRYYKNNTNIGLARTLNKGLQLAQGKYIARMDADDISMPTRLAKQVRYMEANPEYIVCGTRFKIMGKLFGGIDNIHSSSDKIKSQLVISTCFGHPTVMIRNHTLQHNSLSYDIEYDNAEDYKLWSDLSKYGHFHNIPEILLEYRQNYNGVSNTKAQNQIRLSREIRRALINEYISSILNHQYILPDKIYLDDLKFIRKQICKGVVLDDNILTSCYLSLSANNIKAFVFFLFSFDFMRVTPYYFIRIVKQLLFRRNEFISL